MSLKRDLHSRCSKITVGYKLSLPTEGDRVIY